MVFSAGCEKDDSGNGKLKKLDIVNASSLFIASEVVSKSSLAKGSIDGSKLFKITDDGYVEEVEYLDDEGNEITVTYFPNAIYNVCDNYVIVVLNSDANGYLVRKNDGAVFSLAGSSATNEWVPIPYKYDYATRDVISTDAQGRAYYRAVNKDWIPEVAKVNFDNPDNIIAQRISPTDEYVEIFSINNEGAVIFYSYTFNRIITSDGSLINVPYEHPNPRFWQGLDGEIYFLKNVGIDSIQVVQFTIDNNNLIEENYGSVIEYDFNGLYSHWFGQGGGVYKLYLQEKLFIIASGVVFEVFNPSSQPVKVGSLGMSYIRYAAASDHYYYIAGNNEAFQPTLKKVNGNNNVAEDILTPGEYDIYNMIVTENDIVTFTGVRMSDGRRVIGEIDSAGSLSIVDEELGSEVIVFERIN